MKKTNIVAMSALTFLFFSFGFVTAMNNILIPYMKSLFSLSDSQSMFINLVWYGAYAVGSIPASSITERWGYKRGVLIGLLVCALGGALYYPAAVVVSYSFFLVATFVLALGITLLQVAANPYVVEVGPHERTSVRMNIVGTASSSASMIAPIIGSALFLGAMSQWISPEQQKAISDGASVSLTTAQTNGIASALQMPYLTIVAAFVTIGIIFSLIKLPAITHNNQGEGTIAQAWQHKHLRFGVLAIFFYVGLEIAAPSFMIRYATDSQVWGIDASEAAKYVTFYFAAMLVGRFAGIFVMRRISDRQSLTFDSICGIALVAVAILCKGPVAIIALVASGYCQSKMWGNIFALGTKGLDNLTNRATSLMLTAIAGGGVITVLMGLVADYAGIKTAIAMVIPIYLYMIWYATKAELMTNQKA